MNFAFPRKHSTQGKIIEMVFLPKKKPPHLPTVMRLNLGRGEVFPNWKERLVTSPGSSRGEHLQLSFPSIPGASSLGSRHDAQVLSHFY